MFMRILVMVFIGGLVMAIIIVVSSDLITYRELQRKLRKEREKKECAT